MIDFTLTPKQKAIQKSVREFAQKEIKPVAMEYDQKANHEEAYPWDLFKKSFEVGVHDAFIPEEYGGQGLDCLTTTLIWEEVAAADAGFCISFQGHFLSVYTVCNPAVNEEVRKQFLEALMKGEGGMAAFGLAEPNTGPCWSIAQKDFTVETTLEPNGDDYVLNGVKTFCTNGGAPLTKWYVFRARPKGAEPGEKNLKSCFVWADTPGISVPKCENKMGQRMSKTAEVYLDNVRVPRAHVIGPPAKFGSNKKRITAHPWILLGALCLGLSRSAYNEALNYAKERIMAGKPGIQWQLVGAKLADMHWRIEAFRAYLWKTAHYFDNNAIPDLKLAQGAKVMGSDLAVKVTHDALQIHGGYGYTKDALIEKLYRDARVTQIYECPNELLRVSTAQMLELGI